MPPRSHTHGHRARCYLLRVCLAGSVWALFRISWHYFHAPITIVPRTSAHRFWEHVRLARPVTEPIQDGPSLNHVLDFGKCVVLWGGSQTSHYIPAWHDASPRKFADVLQSSGPLSIQPLSRGTHSIDSGSALLLTQGMGRGGQSATQDMTYGAGDITGNPLYAPFLHENFEASRFVSQALGSTSSSAQVGMPGPCKQTGTFARRWQCMPS